MDTFHIPRNTFTSFRLSYLGICEISESSKTLLLGKIPHVWLEDETAGLLSSSVRLAKQKVNTSLKDSVKLITGSKSNGVTLSRVRKLDKILMDARRQLLDDGSGTELNSDDDSESSISGSTWNDASRASRVGLKYSDVYETSIDNVPRMNTLQIQHLGDDSNRQTYLDSPYEFQKKDPKSKHRSRSGTGTLRVEIADPMPFTEDYGELTVDERKKHKLRKRFKKLAKQSRGSAVRRTNDFGHKIYRSLIKSFEVGETIMKEKVLVLTKETVNTQALDKFEENEPCDTRITERWQEYYLLLTKSDSGVVLQFFKVSDDSSNSGKEKPLFEQQLTSLVKVNFYSIIDKSIGIAYPIKNWITINIIKFNNQKKSLKWLFFLKQVVGDTMDPTFSVKVPDVGASIDISISHTDILDMIMESPNLEVHTLSKGYETMHTPLIQYILDEVVNSLKKNKYTLACLLKIDNPWLCFRHYDHLEWIIDDSELFLVQNQVLKDSFVLELRNMTIKRRHLELDSSTLIEPTPIEGFLSRLTTASGNEVHYLRTFYKVLYFSTFDNLLFFGKYYRGIPPVTTSQVEEDVNEHCSYILNEMNHVEWLNSSDFKQKDQKCLEEFLRRTMHVNKADSVIDLTLVVDIKPIPLQEIKFAHKVLLGVLWYGDSKQAENDFIVDSAFEITTQNYGKIRLQAPNRSIRDQWIKRLADIKDYWNCKKQDEIERIVTTRAKNMKLLQIDEYIDSNILLETNLNQIRYSTADPLVNSIDSITLTNSITMNGYLYQKYKKHSNFNQYFAVLNSGLLILYSIYTRSKVTGEWKRVPYFHRHLTIPLTNCYVYSGLQTASDLLDKTQTISNPGISSLPRIYGDGWKSQEEEANRCFTIWFGRKRNISKGKIDEPKNPGLAKLIKKLGITGQSIVFMARSRQERELWVTRIYREIDRYSLIFNIQ